MTKAKHAWSAPKPSNNDEFQVWDHFGCGRMMDDRVRAFSFVAKEDTMRIAVLEGDGVYSDVTEAFCREWLGQQQTFTWPEYVPLLVKHTVDDWEEINNALPEGTFFKKEIA